MAKRKGNYKPGPGRPKGLQNKRTRELREEIERLVESGAGLSPAMVLFKIANDRRVGVSIRGRAAADLMPYLHPKLSTIDMNLDGQLEGGLRVEIVPAQKKGGDG